MRIQFLFLMALFIVPTAARAEYPIYSFKEKTDLNQSQIHGEAILSVSPAVIRIGETLEVRTLIANLESADRYFFNITFNRLLEYPASLIIYDASKTCLGDLLYWLGGSRKGISLDCWTMLRSYSFAGRIFYLTPHKHKESHIFVEDSPFRTGLPAGTYYLQMVYHSLAIAPPPPESYNDLFFVSDRVGLEGRKDEESKRIVNYFLNVWNQIPRRDDLFRSNIVEIQLLDSSE